ncbi:MAG: PIG-L family deacetylase, partial [candidate division KSB1 bacterium]|nr:PIG-L family deacetylase [candidate division KSB1 bacterium]
PGFEDLVTLAYFRLARGSRVISLYVTNGEATPDHFLGEPPARLAGRRKAEAYRALAYLGGETYFLNLPDSGLAATRGEAERVWPPHEVVTKLIDAITKFSPHVIFLPRDRRSETGETLRHRLLKEFLLAAVREASRSTNAVEATPSLRPTVFFDEGTPDQSFRVKAELRHPIWKKSYRQMATEAAQHYQSLAGYFKTSTIGEERSYTAVYPDSGRVVFSLEEGISLQSSALQSTVVAIDQIVQLLRQGDTKNVPGLVTAALAEIDLKMAREVSQLTPLERSALIEWKIDLEKLRCTLLDVDVQFEVSDSLVTQSQLFFLTFKKFKSKAKGGTTQVFFPGVKMEGWAINETVGDRFPLELNQEYRIITPKKLAFNAPPASFGRDRPRMWEDFSFMLLHRDPQQREEFSCRFDVPLGVGPRFAVEILTPIVAAIPGERLVYRFQNFTRDGVYGEAFVEEPSVISNRKFFRLSKKDAAVRDTLTLSWLQPLPPGDYTFALKISDDIVGHFLARKFEAIADTTQQVGVITALQASPVVEAIRRLHIPYVMLDQAKLKSDQLTKLAAIVVDEETSILRADFARAMPLLYAFARHGGHLIFLPQWHSLPTPERIPVGFAWGQGLPPPSEVMTENSHSFLTQPNRLGPNDWQGWILARAWGSIALHNTTGLEIPVRSKATKAPLVVTLREGEGRITYVALNLSQQLLNVHPGAHRLLANLLNNVYIGRPIAHGTTAQNNKMLLPLFERLPSGFFLPVIQQGRGKGK